MKWISTILLAASILLLSGCSKRTVTFTRSMLGTQITISAHDYKTGYSRDDAILAIESAFREIDRIQTKINWEGIKQLNDLAGYQSYDIGQEMADLVSSAYQMSELTDGAYTPDIGPLTKLWGFMSDTIHIPNEFELDSAMTIMEQTEFSVYRDGLAYLEPSRARLDLGGFAKGYAVDRACEVLMKSGVSAGIVEAGGDLRCFGSKPDGSQWKIAIRHPRNLEEYFTVINIDSGAVATSGDYERVVFVDGFRYHHIIDPMTGFPATMSVSATVVASSCAMADALATGYFILGPDEGIGAANGQELPALIIEERNNTLTPHRTNRFKSLEQSFE